ncbi:MAG: thioredoxin family protein, partial [Porticoccaceae bacterium]|nr:thioredoxin family protein [Porticoccaceae bacterium]
LTADWCITCLANERIALSSDTFAATLKQRDITYLKGDWTNQNPEITALLNANQRNGVPLYLYYRAGQSTPEILPQILTPSLVREALER